MEEKKEFPINIKAELMTGKYSNSVVIAHSRSEFILDFAAMLPGVPQPEVVSRIIMAPEHAKRLMLALQDNVAKYENQFSQIQLGQAGPVPGFPITGIKGNKS